MAQRLTVLAALLATAAMLGAALRDRADHAGGMPGSSAATALAIGDVERGRSLARDCRGCHSIDGSTEFGPTWRGLYGSRVELQDGSVVVADAAYLEQSICDPMAEIRRGFPPTMPGYPTLSQQDVADLIAYIMTLQAQPMTSVSAPAEADASPPPDQAATTGLSCRERSNQTMILARNEW